MPLGVSKARSGLSEEWPKHAITRMLSSTSPTPPPHPIGLQPQVDYTPGAGGGAGDGSLLQRFMGTVAAITTVFFAFGGHSIALEIQATLPFPPTTVRPMMQGDQRCRCAMRRDCAW